MPEKPEAEALQALEGPMKLARIAKLIEEIEDLPTLPAILNRVSEVVNDPESSAADLAKVVSCDGSLSAKLLRLANSPAYGFSRKISDIQHAIALLGFAETQALAVSASVFDQLSNKADFDYKGHWHHSLATATLSRMISFHLKVGGMETAFTAGLLHDVGKLLLAIKMGGKQERVESLFSSEVGVSRQEVEQKVLGITHAEVGYLLGEHWLLPSIVTGAIRHHHSPELDAESKIITNRVDLGNLYCEASQFADSIVFDDSVLQSLEILEISQDAFRETLKSYSQIVAEIPPIT
jgi:putative nucleotidyltransferase with HDIG domain